MRDGILQALEQCSSDLSQDYKDLDTRVNDLDQYIESIDFDALENRIKVYEEQLAPILAFDNTHITQEITELKEIVKPLEHNQISQQINELKEIVKPLEHSQLSQVIQVNESTQIIENRLKKIDSRIVLLESSKVRPRSVPSKAYRQSPRSKQKKRKDSLTSELDTSNEVSESSIHRRIRKSKLNPHRNKIANRTKLSKLYEILLKSVNR